MQKYLILLPNNLGDVIMVLPVLRALKQEDSTRHISFFAESGFEGGLVNSPCCDHIISFERKALKAACVKNDGASVQTQLKALLDGLNSEAFEVVINLSQTGYLSYITTLVKAPRKVGRRFLYEGNHALPDRWSQYLYAIAFAREYNALHASEVYCRIAGVPPNASAGELIVLTPDEKSSAAKYLAAKGCPPGRKYLILQPGAAYQSKRWPEAHFSTLGGLLAHDGYTAVITGAPAELPLCRRVAGAIGISAIVSANERTFRETIALCENAACIVTGDTALMHAGAALGKRVIALFGSTNPVETGPYGVGHTVFVGECPNKPCFKTECSSRACMNSITPESVHCAVGGMLTEEIGRQAYISGFSGSTWGLSPVSSTGKPLCNAAGAALIRSLFDDDATLPATPEVTREMAALHEFVALCAQMERVLLFFMDSGNGMYLQRFETLRQQAAATGGAGAFLNAVINIRLNSVPLFDPMKGIAESIEVCRSTIRQIKETALR